ncbi:MAG TPA: hypothetical protein DEA27_03090 [Candidatus Moranbacteria bacterium]|nr:hypothetical protein [Candidatus Moranbacteria bacterium]
MELVFAIASMLLNVICFITFLGGILCWILAFFGTTGLYDRRKCQSLLAVGAVCFVIAFIGDALLNLI